MITANPWRDVMKTSAYMMSFISSLALFGCAAVAADLKDWDRISIKDVEQPVPVPQALWGGFFIGGGLGVAMSKIDTSVEGKQIVVAPDAVTESSPLLRQTLHDAGSMSSERTSLTGSVQAGYNWHFQDRYLIGVVADYWWLDSAGKSQVSSNIPWSTTPGWTQRVDFASSVSQTWLATARLRAGLTFDRIMIYATGGLAWGALNASAASQTHADNIAYAMDPSLRPVDGSDLIARGSGGVSGVAMGYAFGAGMEMRLSGNWLLSGDYLYYDLERKFDVRVNGNQPFYEGGSSFSNSVRSSGHLVRVGLNYLLAWR